MAVLLLKITNLVSINHSSWRQGQLLCESTFCPESACYCWCKLYQCAHIVPKYKRFTFREEKIKCFWNRLKMFSYITVSSLHQLYALTETAQWAVINCHVCCCFYLFINEIIILFKTCNYFGTINFDRVLVMMLYLCISLLSLFGLRAEIV